MDYFAAPDRFEAQGILLRSYDVGDGPLLSAAVNESYQHLRTWMPWAKPHQTAEESEHLVRQFRGRYLLAQDLVIGVFSPDNDRLLGGTGFHLREGPISTGCAEIGIFIRESEAGKGLGTRVLEAMLQWGFLEWPWLRLSWRCDTRNLASVRVAAKAGLRLEGIHRGVPVQVGEGRRDMACYAVTKSERVAPAMNIAVLASHEGTTLQAVLDACGRRDLPARVAVVVSNNSGSGALVRARAAGCHAVHLSSATHHAPEELDAALVEHLRQAQVDVVLLAGFMKKLGPITVREFSGRIVNTHPALLPKFAGVGMYGMRVHEAVLTAGETVSGASAHLVDGGYDPGAVIAQRQVGIVQGDTPETLAARVQECERRLVVDVLRDIAVGELKLPPGATRNGLTARTAS